MKPIKLDSYDWSQTVVVESAMFIYLLSDDQCSEWKVGRACDLDKRTSSYRAHGYDANVLTCFVGTKHDETALLSRGLFESTRGREWLAPSWDVLRWFAGLHFACGGEGGSAVFNCHDGLFEMTGDAAREQMWILGHNYKRCSLRAVHSFQCWARRDPPDWAQVACSQVLSLEVQDLPFYGGVDE